MKLERRFERVDSRIEDFKRIKVDSLGNFTMKTWDLLYILNIGGTLIRKYQKPLAHQLGWQESDLTIRNAVYCGILPAAGYVILNQFFGDNAGETFQRNFYYYPGFMAAVGIARTGYSLFTEKAIGSPSFYNFIGTSVYAIEEFSRFLRKRKKPAEGIEPPTYASPGKKHEFKT